MNAPTILAVDDDEVNLHIIQEIFADEPVEMHVASSGHGALELLGRREFSPDVLILDRMMPGLDGMAVLKKVKSSARHSLTPVVMQTAAAAPEEVEQGLRAGAYYYLTKPYSPEALRSIVRAALEHCEMRRKLASRQHEAPALMRFTASASYVFRTIDEAGEVGSSLGQFCSNTGAATLGLTELLLNAVEHGNLALSYHEKSELQRRGRWRAEIDRRAELPEFRERRVHVGFERTCSELRFVIRDEGAGFEWQRYLEFDPIRAFDPNGRGIAMARALAFASLRYEAGGSVAIASIDVT